MYVAKNSTLPMKLTKLKTKYRNFLSSYIKESRGDVGLIILV